jgi:hypothetical protein
MSKVTVTESYLEGIGDAIRNKLNTSQGYTPGQMAAAIESIPTGGITPTGTKSITQNGQTDVTQYATADVNVPNSYAAGDEGKVVQNGALVAQTSETVTQNGTYDTTTKDEVVVNVSGGGGGGGAFYLVDPAQLDAYNAASNKENGFPVSCIMARYATVSFYTISLKTFGGASVPCLYRPYNDICGIAFTPKLAGGTYTKAYIKCKVISKNNNAQRAWVGLLPTCDFDNSDGWFFEGTGRTVIRLADTDMTAEQINGQQGVVISVSDNKNVPEQTVEITLPQTDCYVALLNWNTEIQVREIRVE